MNEVIQFKKQRDLGAILTDTFKFIRLNFKPLFGLIFRMAGPALLVLILAFIYYNQALMNTINDGFVYNDNIFTVNVILALLLVLVAGVAFYGLLYSTILHYIKSYIKNRGVAKKEEVTEGIKKNFWSLIGLSFLVGIITGIGLVFCFIPGIYLGTVLVTTYSIHVFEKRDVSDSISHSFKLIKDEWWITFATLLVMFIIYYIVIVIGSIPQLIYDFGKGFTISEQFDLESAYTLDWGSILLSAFSMVIQYLMQSLIVITSCFIYFNLNEKKNFSGTYEAIEELGKRDDGIA